MTQVFKLSYIFFMKSISYDRGGFIGGIRISDIYISKCKKLRVYKNCMSFKLVRLIDDHGNQYFKC